MKSFFVAGTDTGVGKTVVTGLCARYLSDCGVRVVTQKWVQTGSRLQCDLRTHDRFLPSAAVRSSVADDDRGPYLFPEPCSPHLAARRAQRTIRAARILRAFKRLADRADIVIVEGSGGLLVPLNGRLLMIDLVLRMRLPVLLVSPNRVGAINHTLLSLEALRRRKIPCLGVVFNAVPGTKRTVSRDNQNVIRAFSGIRIIGELPRCAECRGLLRSFSPLGVRLFGRRVP